MVGDVHAKNDQERSRRKADVAKCLEGAKGFALEPREILEDTHGFKCDPDLGIMSIKGVTAIAQA
jgi:hypothetical protein